MTYRSSIVKTESSWEAGVFRDARANLAELVSIAIGTPTGWMAFVDRIRELLASDADEDATHKAVYHPLGGVTRPEYDEQLDLRRRALRDVRLAAGDTGRRRHPADGQSPRRPGEAHADWVRGLAVIGGRDVAVML
jgi:hypothetical protein